MIILPKQKAVFVHVPKTGGDFVSRLLMNNVPKAYHSGGGKHWPAWMHGGLTGNFKFAFVREPVSWYRSYYSFIMQNYIVPHGNYPIFEAGKYHPMRRWERYDFSTFRTMIYDIYSDDPAYYTRLLDWMLGPAGSRMMNFIGKQENLAEDFSIVLDQLGLERLVERCLQMKKVNTSDSIFDVDRDLIDLIQANEHAVYRRFNYAKK